MFNWKRPQEMHITEPTEEQIWAKIEEYDPRYTASINDRLMWHQEMLEERNIYEDCFTRSSRMPEHDAELPPEYNPASWITNLTLRHLHDTPIQKVADSLSYGSQKILQPADDSGHPPGIVHILSYYILNRKAEDWEPKSTFGTPLSAVIGYTTWARYHLRVHHNILKKAGVYHAIYQSLFSYGHLPFAWVRGIAEHWDSDTNTCWMGTDELTITLADMQDITGLPVLGTPFEECIPPDCELFQRQKAEGRRKGEFVYPTSLHRVLTHYYKFFENKKNNRRNRGTVTLNTWSRSFLHKKVCVAQYAELYDPFDLREDVSRTSFKERYEPEGGVNMRYILNEGIDEEMSLVAFIATWLCYFVFPNRNGAFRPSTLLMASLIARGERIALAPAALAFLYRGLRRVGALTNNRNYDVEAPWHYLHGWISEHISGSFSRVKTPKFYKEQGYPILMRLTNAITAVNTIQIRTFMFAPWRMTDRFKIVHQSKMRFVKELFVNVSLKDTLIENQGPLLLSKQSYRSIAEYLIGIRPSWLCYRRHDSIFLERYNPNRVARQYGFTQATPNHGLPSIQGIEDARSIGELPYDIRLKATAESWALLLRLGTGSEFYIAPRCSNTGISHYWLTWIRHTFSSFLEMGFRIYCPLLKEPVHPQHLKHKKHEPSRTDQAAPSKRKRSASPSPRPRPIRTESLQRHEELRPDANAHIALSDQMDKESGAMFENRTILSSAVCQDQPPPMYNEPQINEEIQVLEIGRQLEEAVASTSASAYPLFVMPNEERVLNSQGSETTSRVLEEADAVSQEPLVSGLDLHDNVCTSEELPVASINKIIETEESFPPDSACMPKLISECQVPEFISKIRTRTTGIFKGCFSQSSSFITSALQGLIADVNMEALPELDHFCHLANSLLDSAAIVGLEAQSLQHWESELRKVESAIFSIQGIDLEKLTKERDIAEAKYKDLMEKAGPTRDNLKEKQIALQVYETETMQTDKELARIIMELKKLEQKKQQLIQEEKLINQKAADIKMKYTQIKSQVVELEKITEPLSQQIEMASQHLQTVQYQYEQMIAHVKAAMQDIGETKAKYL